MKAILLIVLSSVLIQNARVYAFRTGGEDEARFRPGEKQEMLELVTSAYKRITRPFDNSPYHPDIVAENGITEQMVAGLIYRLNLDIAANVCPRRRNCMARKEVKNCKVTLYEIVWQNSMSLQFNCTSVS